MSYSRPLTEREKALEEAFFRDQNARLIESLRVKKAAATQKEALAAVIGVRDESILSPLHALGVRAENVAALVLAPLVAVAWADHQLDAEERRALIEAEQHFGIDPDSESGRLLATWLAARPHESLLGAWTSYVQQLCRVLAPDERTKLRDEIVGRASAIARSFEKSFLRGGGPTRAEAEVLAKVEAAFAESSS
jgi:hypothetical protein